MRAMLCAVLVVLCGGAAFGQSPAAAVAAPPFPAPSYGLDYYPFGYRHSSTPLEGAGHGLADVIRSIGRANLENSEAAVNLGEAQRRQIENYRAGTQAYFDMRELNRLRRAAEEKRLINNPELSARYAQAARPRLLSNRELDAATGEIHWPIMLLLRQFDDQRATLEKIFADRAYHGSMGAQDFLVVRHTADDMLASLREQVYYMPPQQYMSARRFLESLSYEAARPAG